MANSESYKKWYEKNKEYYLLKERDRYNSKKEQFKFLYYPEDCGCLFCNSYDDLEYHHLDKRSKEFSIGNMYKNCIEVLSEMSKCILICKQCHLKIYEGDMIRDEKGHF